MSLELIIFKVFTPIYLVIFTIYILGFPTFIIRQINKIWGLRITLYNIQLVQILSFIFIGLLLIETIKVKNLNDKLLDDRSFSNYLMLSKSERNIFLYLTYIVLTLSCLKFADIYGKKLELKQILKECQKTS